MDARLYRSRDDRMLAGVAGGLAEYWDADPSLVRLIWALLVIFTGGIALLVYIVMAFVVPEAPPSLLEVPANPAVATSTGTAQAAREARRAARRDRRSGGSQTAALVIGLMIMFAGIWFLIEELFPAFDTDVFWPVALIVLGIAFLAVAVRPRRAEPALPSIPPTAEGPTTGPIPPSAEGPASEPGTVAGLGS